MTASADTLVFEVCYFGAQLRSVAPYSFLHTAPLVIDAF
jgi:hypothetical protein